VHKLLQVLLVTGYTDVLMLRVLTEAGLIGVLALWIGSLLAVRRLAKAGEGYC
jgi:cell division protein FtsX